MESLKQRNRKIVDALKNNGINVVIQHKRYLCIRKNESTVKVISKGKNVVGDFVLKRLFDSDEVKEFCNQEALSVYAFGGETEVSVFDSDWGLIDRHTSACSLKDVFCKARGVNLALEEIISNNNYTV